jgi:hypothetical protein
MRQEALPRICHRKVQKTTGTVKIRLRLPGGPESSPAGRSAPKVSSAWRVQSAPKSPAIRFLALPVRRGAPLKVDLDQPLNIGTLEVIQG